MEEKYLRLISAYKNLDIEDKKEELLREVRELLLLLYKYNSSYDSNNSILPVFKKDETDDDYFNKLFTYIISLKEENAKLIEIIINNYSN